MPYRAQRKPLAHTDAETAAETAPLRGHPSSKFRCDYCRSVLRADCHVYYMMRFCSDGCIAAYKRRLSGTTVAKVQVLHASGRSRTLDPARNRSNILALRHSLRRVAR